MGFLEDLEDELPTRTCPIGQYVKESAIGADIATALATPKYSHMAIARALIDHGVTDAVVKSVADQVSLHRRKVCACE